MKKLLTIVGTQSATISVPDGSRALLRSLTAQVTTADINGDTIVIAASQSTQRIWTAYKSSIGQTAYELSAGVGLQSEGDEKLLSTVVATGVATYYQPDSKSTSLPEIWMTGDVLIVVTGESTAVCTSLVLKYEVDDGK
jgi:hypothetical protein